MNAGKALLVCVNKWDGLSQDEKTKVKEDLGRKFQFLQFAKFHFISALKGSGVGNIYADIDAAHASAMRKFPTSELTRVLQDAVREQAPPRIRGIRPKLRYAHQGGSNPPVIVIHGNQATSLGENYKRYLSNVFRRVLNVSGTPIRFEFKQGDNPFVQSGKPKRQVRHSSRRAKAIAKTQVKRRAKKLKSRR